MLQRIFDQSYSSGRLFDYCECFRAQDVLTNSIISKEYELFKYVVDNGARVNIIYKHGLTALTFACAHGQFKMVKYLIKHNCLISGVNYDNSFFNVPAIVKASYYGHFKIVKYLIKHGIMITEKDNQHKHTALDEAYLNGKFEVVNYIRKITLKRLHI